jgi:hypothetical protein
MTMKRPSDFVAIKRVEDITDPKVLRMMLFRAETRVYEAKYIGWPALAQSWQRNVDAIQARMAELGIGQGATRDRRSRSRPSVGRRVEEAVCA